MLCQLRWLATMLWLRRHELFDDMPRCVVQKSIGMFESSTLSKCFHYCSGYDREAGAHLIAFASDESLYCARCAHRQEAAKLLLF